MFDRLRWQLLLSYLGVFTAILGVFAIAVRLVFGYSLRQSLSQELIILAKVAATHAEIKDNRLIVSDEFTGSNVALSDREFEWFDRQKSLVNKVGNLNVNLPLNINPTVQFNKYSGQKPDETISAIVPIISNDNQQQIGYVRITQSLDALDRTFHKLDVGLISGMILSVIISGGAGIWLTRRAMKPTVTSYQRLQQFTADAAHELRSPLMAVKTNASTALKYPDGMRSGDLKKFNAIASATEQIITLTEDLLMLARAENDPDSAAEQIDLALLLQQIATKYQAQIDAKSIRIEVAIQPNLLLQGYTRSLHRVFINLLENAIHYTPSGGKIRILAHSPGERLRQRIEKQIETSIIDTGVGIDPTDLERIFDRFWRGDRARTRWEGGSGLGLAIAKSIVEQHHGSIDVKSKLGEGSQFIVRLPAMAQRETIVLG
jgi:two-component system, OmpR family, manganese sensing sensor histidine kinase